MKYAHLLAVALLAGAIGGSLSTYAVLTYTRGHSQQVVRAQRFELVDSIGRTNSFWGVDSAGQEVLAFGGRETERDAAAGSRDQQLVLGLEGKRGRPFLGVYGSDAQIRALLNLDDFQRPLLAMSNGNGLGLTLGSERSDTPGIRDKTERWALSFLPEERARIGVSAQPEPTGLFAQGFLRVQPEKLRLSQR